MNDPDRDVACVLSKESDRADRLDILADRICCVSCVIGEEGTVVA